MKCQTLMRALTGGEVQVRSCQNRQFTLREQYRPQASTLNVQNGVVGQVCSNGKNLFAEQYDIIKATEQDGLKPTASKLKMMNGMPTLGLAHGTLVIYRRACNEGQT